MTHHHGDARTPTAAHLDLLALRRAFGAYATGVTVVTACRGDGEFVGLTVNSFTSVSLDPPLVLWSQSLRAPSLSAFREATHFVVNVLRDNQVEVSKHFARSHVDKFATIAHTPSRGGAPILPGTLAHFECATEFEYEGGDHAIFVGRVVDYSISEGSPLIFWAGRYLKSQALSAS